MDNGQRTTVYRQAIRMELWSVVCCLLTVVNCKRHEEHLTQDGRLGAKGGHTYILWQGIGHGGNLLRHDLSGTIDIGAPVKLDPYDRETRGR